MVFSFIRHQKLPISQKEAWDFFSNPVNLPLITPPHLKFVITSEFLPEKIYSGQIITYQVRPFLNFPLTWLTEITHINEPVLFVDEQRVGPYRFWQHQHHLKAVVGGVEMIDLIHYQLPLWWLGKLINKFSVHHHINFIFNYRREKLIQRFGSL